MLTAIDGVGGDSCNRCVRSSAHTPSEEAHLRLSVSMSVALLALTSGPVGLGNASTRIPLVPQTVRMNISTSRWNSPCLRTTIIHLTQSRLVYDTIPSPRRI